MCSSRTVEETWALESDTPGLKFLSYLLLSLLTFKIGLILPSIYAYLISKMR